MIIDGKAIAAKIRLEIKDKTEELIKTKNIIPVLAVILAGDDPASAIYVRNKIKACEETGIKSLSYTFDNNVTEDKLIELIHTLNDDDLVHGILVQLPLPKHINSKKVMSTIADNKDVDGYSAYNIGQLALGVKGYRSCTPYGVMKLLEYSGIEIEGKQAVIIGRSNTVGKPLVLMMLEKNATVTVCHSKTRNLSEVTKTADILVSATGQALSVSADMVKPGAVVIDVGIAKVDGKTVGDVRFDEVSKVASMITPVPGGVGPMTIAMLLYNTLESASG